MRNAFAQFAHADCVNVSLCAVMHANWAISCAFFLPLLVFLFLVKKKRAFEMLCSLFVFFAFGPAFKFKGFFLLLKVFRSAVMHALQLPNEFSLT